MRTYCTLFDAAYLDKGLAMYRSLVRHSSVPFVLHVLALDKTVENVMDGLPGVQVLPLEPFEKDCCLGPVRLHRSYPEYCWTLASVFTNEVMKRFQPDHATYLDSDLFFFSDPEIAFTEIGERSIGIVPHRFPPERAFMECNGRFNVSLVYFRNSRAGRDCLARWSAKCIEWCYAKVQPGRFGDQKYLDDWSRDYPGEVCEIANSGVGLAPWNISQYRIAEIAGTVCASGQRVVFYHMHEFKQRVDGTFQLTNYPLRPEDKWLIYEPYLAEMESVCTR